MEPTEREISLERFGVTLARVRAAAALRRLGHEMVSANVGDGWLDDVAVAADALSARAEGVPRRVRSMSHLVDVDAGSWPGEAPEDGEVMSHFPDCVVSGEANPMGVAMAVRREGDAAVARVVLGPAFEGAPGQSHGGVVAAVFDDVMGYQLSILRVPAFTGRLTVTYRAPTPIGVPLEFRARVEGRDERKLHLAASALLEGGELFAEAKATFVVVSVERMMAGRDAGGGA